ncbi:probable glutathione reductase 2 [Nilaparvata lugens]|uniref:probable glutathione reductase 2 n=1 Tax=Nilaparvata lugens TaxID=108931 RepID=UPI00193CDDFD|nr:probable glutathione reductase 2 [Nilaparvata lugens]
MPEYDVIVIGSGIGGRSAAIEAQKHRLSVAVFDYVRRTPCGNSWLVGGNSINAGDIPTKLFYKASQFYSARKEASKLGLTLQINGQTFKWVPFMNNVQLFCHTLAMSQQALLHESGINFHNGYVSFLDRNTVQTTGFGIIKNKYKAQIFILATGTQPTIPKEIFGYEYAITSDDIFSLKKCPAKVLIVGCSSTSVECAGFLRLIGVSVTIVVDSQPLKNVDDDCACRIIEHLDLLGVKILWKYKVERIEEVTDRIDLRPTTRILGSQVDHLQANLKNYFSTKRTFDGSQAFRDTMGSTASTQPKFKEFVFRPRKVFLRKVSNKEERASFSAEWSQHPRLNRIKQKMLPIIIDTYEVVMFAQGRAPRVYDMGLRELNVVLDSDGKVVANNHDETGCESIYAIGDVVSGRPGLSSVAAKCGKLLIGRLFNNNDEIVNYDFVPRVILSPIKYSYAGLTEKEAIKIYGYYQIEVYERSFRPLSWKILKTNKSATCYAKMVCVERSMGEDRVVGLHYIGPLADEIIQGFELVLKLGVDRKTINDMITVYPSDAIIFSRLSPRSKSP